MDWSYILRVGATLAVIGLAAGGLGYFIGSLFGYPWSLAVIFGLALPLGFAAWVLSQMSM